MHTRGSSTLVVMGLLALVLSATGCPGQAPREETSNASSTPAGKAVEGPAVWAARWPATTGELSAVACDRSETPVQPLDALENPYRDRYSEMDYWCMAHSHPDEAALLQYWTNQAPADYEVANIVVDRDGYVVPRLEIYRLNITLAHLPPGEEFQRADYPYLDVDSVMVHPDTNQCMRSFKAGGELPRELRIDFEAGICRLLAPHVPTVPHWLAEAPPRLVLLMTDGEIVAFGEPDSGDDKLLSLGDAEEEPTEPWLRYSHDGELLKRVEAGGSWIELFFPEYLKVRSELEERGCKIQIQGGLVIALIPGATGPEALFTYRGEALDAAILEQAPPLPYEEIPGRLVRFLYDAQQAGLRNGSAGGI